MKISKKTLKKLIMEEVGGQFLPGNNGPLGMVSGTPPTLKNFGASGRPPEPTPQQKFQGRPPYETLGVEVTTQAEDTYITIGKIVYMLKFDNEDLTSGHVVPIGEYKFTIDGNRVDWNDNAPVHVKFDSHLEKQIMEFSGREDNIK